MDNANVALVQRLYAAFVRGDVPTILQALSADCGWTVNGRQTDFPTFGRFNGRAGVQVFFTELGQQLEFTEFSPKEFYGAGNKVFALGHYAMTVKKNGRKIAGDFCHVFTIDNGIVVSFIEFADTAQAAEAFRS